jgi:hypothetical protein
MVLAFRDNHHAAVPIPPGEEIDLVGPAEDDRFVIVRANGEEFLVFETDLSSRATLLTGKPAVRERPSRSREMAVGA